MIPPTATSQMKGVRIVQPKGKRPFISHYKKKALLEIEEKFTLALKPHRPPSRITGPIELECEWVFPWRSSEPKQIRTQYERIRKDTKPDCDNINKLLQDVMTELDFWKDDSQVCKLNVAKFWGDHPGISVQIIYGDSLPTMPKKTHPQS